MTVRRVTEGPFSFRKALAVWAAHVVVMEWPAIRRKADGWYVAWDYTG